MPVYTGIEKINEVVEYIESHITGELSCETMARMMQLSVYEFRRIFSFVVGCPISEYIRCRRLTLAACELMAQPTVDMTVLGLKYGYSSQAAFSKAFKEVHGVSPSVCLKESGRINLFTKPRFELTLHGNETIPFQIMKQPAFSAYGYRGISSITDTCCCENVWNGFYECGMDARLAAAGGESIYACYDNDSGNGDVVCMIGCILEQQPPHTEVITIPSSRWACFAVDTTQDDAVNGIYNKIYFEWLPSAKLTKAPSLPVVEVYPFDMSKDGFSWEIRIPII